MTALLEGSEKQTGPSYRMLVTGACPCEFYLVIPLPSYLVLLPICSEASRLCDMLLPPESTELTTMNGKL
jgi:hypothetical protein